MAVAWPQHPWATSPWQVQAGAVSLLQALQGGEVWAGSLGRSGAEAPVRLETHLERCCTSVLKDLHPRKDGSTQVCSTERLELAASLSTRTGKKKSEFLPQITWICFYCFTVWDEYVFLDPEFKLGLEAKVLLQPWDPE